MRTLQSDRCTEECLLVLMHVRIPSQISSVRGYEDEANIAYAALLDIEGKTEEAIATLETINNMSSIWHLAQVSCTPNITGISSSFIVTVKLKPRAEQK